MRKKSIIIASLVFVVFALWAILFVLNIANKKIDKEVSKRLDTVIMTTGLGENVQYGGIKTNASIGKIAVEHLRVSFPKENFNIKANVDSIYFKAPPTEIFSFYNNPRTASLSSIKIGIKGLNISIPEAGIKSTVDSIELLAEGKFNQQNLHMSIDKILKSGYSLKLDIRNSSISPGEEIQTLMNMYLNNPNIGSMVKSMMMQSLKLNAKASSDGIDINNFSIKSNIIDFSANMHMTLTPTMEPRNIAASLSVNRLKDTIRSAISPTFEMLEQRLPEEGPFKISVKFTNGELDKFTVKPF